MNEGDIFSSSSKISLKNLQNGKQMEWWVLAPLIFAVLMFLLVGTIFERRIEEKIRTFIRNHLSREGDPANMETQSNGNQTNLPSNSQTQNPCERNNCCLNPNEGTQDKPRTDGNQDNTPTERQKDKSAAPVQETPIHNVQIKQDRAGTEGHKDKSAGPAQQTEVNRVQIIEHVSNAALRQDAESNANVRTSLSRTSRNAVRTRSRHLAPEIQ